jgi:hypothetical protein
MYAKMRRADSLTLVYGMYPRYDLCGGGIS